MEKALKVINPISLCNALLPKEFIGMWARVKAWCKAALLSVDTKGKPKYAHEEDTVHNLPVKDILAAISAVQRESEQE